MSEKSPAAAVGPAESRRQGLLTANSADLATQADFGSPAASSLEALEAAPRPSLVLAESRGLKRAGSSSVESVAFKAAKLSSFKEALGAADHGTQRSASGNSAGLLGSTLELDAAAEPLVAPNRVISCPDNQLGCVAESEVSHRQQASIPTSASSSLSPIELAQAARVNSDEIPGEQRWLPLSQLVDDELEESCMAPEEASEMQRAVSESQESSWMPSSQLSASLVAAGYAVGLVRLAPVAQGYGVGVPHDESQVSVADAEVSVATTSPAALTAFGSFSNAVSAAGRTLALADSFPSMTLRPSSGEQADSMELCCSSAPAIVLNRGHSEEVAPTLLDDEVDEPESLPVTRSRETLPDAAPANVAPNAFFESSASSAASPRQATLQRSKSATPSACALATPCASKASLSSLPDEAADEGSQPCPASASRVSADIVIDSASEHVLPPAADSPTPLARVVRLEHQSTECWEPPEDERSLAELCGSLEPSQGSSRGPPPLSTETLKMTAPGTASLSPQRSARSISESSNAPHAPHEPPAKTPRLAARGQSQLFGHELAPAERGRLVTVQGDGWGAGSGEMKARVIEADDYTFTVIFEAGPDKWKETHVLREHCRLIPDLGD